MDPEPIEHCKNVPLGFANKDFGGVRRISNYKRAKRNADFFEPWLKKPLVLSQTHVSGNHLTSMHHGECPKLVVTSDQLLRNQPPAKLERVDAPFGKLVKIQRTNRIDTSLPINLLLRPGPLLVLSVFIQLVPKPRQVHELWECLFGIKPANVLKDVKTVEAFVPRPIVDPVVFDRAVRMLIGPERRTELCAIPFWWIAGQI